MMQNFVIFFLVLFSSYSSIAEDKLELFYNTFIAIGGGRSLPTTQIGHYIADTKVTNSYHYQNLKKSDVFAISVGKNFGGIKTEIEYLDFGNKLYIQGNYFGIQNFIYNYNLHSKAYMFNLGYRFINFNEYNLEPYVNIAIGFADHKLSPSQLSYLGEKLLHYNAYSNRAFAKGFGVGTLINLNKHFALDLSYKYLDLGQVKSTSTFYHDGKKYSASANNIIGKFRTNTFIAKIVFKL